MNEEFQVYYTEDTQSSLVSKAEELKRRSEKISTRVKVGENGERAICSEQSVFGKHSTMKLSILKRQSTAILIID